VTKLYEVRHPLNRYLGAFIELVDTTGPHPTDCECIGCKPRPKPVYRERDNKEARLFWK
jgi:hypothetical protein